MDNFNNITIRAILLLLLVVILVFWVYLAGPSAFDSGPVGVTMFTFVTLALLLTVINSGYRILTFRR